jgi:membrane-associated phospholipid phosphatase
MICYNSTMINIRSTLFKWIRNTTPSYNTSIRQVFGRLLGPVELLSHIISFTVGEFFLTIAIPSIAITVDPQLARLLMIVYAQNILVCNVVKNGLCLPRPAVIYNNNYDIIADNGTVIESSYGFPSSHSACALATAFFISQYSSLIFCLPISFITTVLITVGWAGMIGCARLVLIRHSIIDVVGGYIIGIFNAIGFDYIWKSGQFNKFLSEPLTGIYILFISIILSFIHPDSYNIIDSKNYSPNDTRHATIKESICIMGCAIGSMLAIWRDNVLPWLKPINITIITYNMLFMVALCSIVLSKIASSTITNRMIPLHNQVNYKHMCIKLRWLISYILFSWFLLDPMTILLLNDKLF